MNRLLYAAARGARIERHMPDLNWCVTNNFPVTTARNNYRIHPDDAHLQFGPISSALRAAAERSEPNLDMAFKDVSAFFAMQGTYDNYRSYKFDAGFEDCPFELHRQLFMLIMSEAIADEGM